MVTVQNIGDKITIWKIFIFPFVSLCFDPEKRGTKFPLNVTDVYDFDMMEWMNFPTLLLKTNPEPQLNNNMYCKIQRDYNRSYGCSGGNKDE
jgi:hypothetical protein